MTSHFLWKNMLRLGGLSHRVVENLQQVVPPPEGRCACWEYVQDR